MIDFGLLMSVIVGLGVPTLLVNWWPLKTWEGGTGFLDVALGPGFAGLAVGRLTALAIDDPTSIGSISDMMIVRSGVEFWPGVAAASVVLAVSARRSGLPILARAADVVPAAMIGYAAYEAACVFRDGCYGPQSSFGIRPPGLEVSMLPVGLLMAAAVAAAAVGVHRLAQAGARAPQILLTAAAVVGAVRATGSVWLPHVGTGITRQHFSSIVLAAFSTATLFGLLMAKRQSGERVLPPEQAR